MRSSVPIVLLALAACQDQGVTVFNSDPEAFLMSHQEGSPVVAGVDVEFRGAVSDGNHDAGQLTVSWTAAGRALCDPGPPSGDGTTTCTAALASGDELLQLTVRDPEGATHTAAAVE